MLRPERMSLVSVTGSKQVMDEAIEAVHDLRLLHVTDYEGSWDGFDPGDPMAGADDASEKLVTVRSLQSILGVEDEDAGPARIVTEDALDTELEEIRTEVNELDDRRDELRDELRAVEDRIATMEPFARLGIDLDLLRGYDSLSVAVGEGDEERVRRELIDADVDGYEIYSEDDVLAVFARTDDLADVLVNAEFTTYEIPDAEGSPDDYLDDLEDERERLQSKLHTVEDELEEQRLDVGGFLLAAEETLAIEVEQREAPLSFATTENAFVAEGWIPTDRFVDLAEGLHEEVGDHIEVDELERAQYDGEGQVVSREEVGGGAPGTPEPTAADGGEVRADGGHASASDGDQRAVRSDGGTATKSMSTSGPPVIQNNPGGVRPFESLVEVINRPKYSELDPTVVIFLTFPLFFGFMIGDLGYGLLYFGLGYYITRNFESDVIRSLGAIGMWAGGFTAIFGVLYGEFFGLHQLGYLLYPSGSPPIHKGLQPHYIYYAQAWLLLSVVVGVLHLALGRLFDFYENLTHGFGEAFVESFSWIILTVGLWAWVFSKTALAAKPPFMFSVFAREGMTNPATGETISEGVAIPLGFNGFPAIDLFTIPGIGIVVDLMLVVTLVGLALVVYAEGGIGLIESITQAFGHVVSYTRLAAVLLAKAGMALAVNLLVFGAYSHDGEFHLIFFSEAAEVAEAQEAGEVIFSGLFNGEGAVMLLLGFIFGVIILVLGHALVLVLGITSAGLQAVRLEYVEFFGKFYEGGGETYAPFGYDRRYTTED
ncbi:V-type ATP synthase subunit I [Halomarina salina]|uniref:A-type ATP synthase subunit I n=1 Tax=Halomarina salina TaxID=1872699 RepID=A0ABD5RLK0_9EURY|nr:V-type ATP synthase subunit I [Halomarina salina]